jgi:hypothetical protein
LLAEALRSSGYFSAALLGGLARVNVAQTGRTGQRGQAGRRAVQSIAPRSMIAWLNA